MTSESEEIPYEDSDESLLDIKEINDLEYDIPTIPPPSLESVLWDLNSEEGSDNASLHSFQSTTARFRSMLFHCILQGLTSQITSAGDRVNAGLPTVITNSLKYVAIGTSHGYLLAFDSEQKLCWCCHDTTISDQGAISALAFNLESTRLLVGYERGFISMVDTQTGDVIRRLPEAHAPQTAVLHLRFSFMSNLGFCGDSSGCVFLLSFSRKLGIRTWDSKCLFSGARGEVCVFEPLLQGQDVHFLNKHLIVAMATLSKVIVISVKPKLKVHFSHMLPKLSSSPLISWQVVSVGKTFQPVLAWGRGNELHYTRLINYGPNNNKIRLVPLRSVQLPYSLTSLHWLGTRHLALMDSSENLRLVEVRTQRELEVLEVASAGLVYGSAHFKALAVGGGVSEAFALAGERACYNSISSRGNQLLILGTKAVHMVKLRTWPERLLYLTEQGRWAEALNLAAEEGSSRESFTIGLLNHYLQSLNQNSIDKDSLTAAINCCVKLNQHELLCNELLDAVQTARHNLDWYFNLITDHITSGALQRLSPNVSQMLVTYLEHKDLEMLDKVLLSLDIDCLDLHQVLHVCKDRKLYNSWIHITTKTLKDYTSPLVEFLGDLSADNSRLGNTMLVYVSSCLAGLGYPNGSIPEGEVQRVKQDVLRFLETLHSVNAKPEEPSYPYLRALLKYNIRECLNVIELAFTEEEFSGEMGLLQRQRLVRILLQIVQQPDFTSGQVAILACFISRMTVNKSLDIDEVMLSRVIEALTSVEVLSLRDHVEREQAWLDLLNTNRLCHINKRDLLKAALEAKCFRIAELLYEDLKDYSNILECYLKDPLRKNEAFSYVLNWINCEERLVREQFFVKFRELVEVNSKKTVEIVLEYFRDSIEQFSDVLEEDELQYRFLSEVVNELKLPQSLAGKYLRLLCMNSPGEVAGFLRNSSLRSEEALEVTRRFQVHQATALLLELSGEWMEALELLLENGMVNESILLCVRGAEHLDAEGAQKLWLFLLKKQSCGDVSLRQLLHAAAPHVPPSQLLELVSNASFGDVKTLLQNMLSDYTHDLSMLSTTFKLLSRDLHRGLVKSLREKGRGVGFRNLYCCLCQKGFVQQGVEEGLVAVFGCGHCFHSGCLSAAETGEQCPKCRNKASLLQSPVRRKEEKVKCNRPDLEGHF